MEAAVWMILNRRWQGEADGVCRWDVLPMTDDAGVAVEDGMEMRSGRGERVEMERGAVLWVCSGYQDLWKMEPVVLPVW